MKKAADILSKTGKWLLVFGFVFSQVSFPLEVLADELTDDENTYEDISVVTEDTDGENDGTDVEVEEPVITINGEKTTEYTINEGSKVTVVLEYQGQTKTEVLDFSNKLYGTYQYTFTSLEKVVTINYLGNNADLFNLVEGIDETTKSIICDEMVCVISGFGVENVTVADVAGGYYDLVAFEDKYNAMTFITDGEKMLLETDLVLNDYELVIEDNQAEVTLENGVLVNTTPTTTYKINRVGDVYVPSDGVIDGKDQEAILDDVLHENEITDMNDINGDGKLNILDATHSTFIDVPELEEVTDILTNTLTTSAEEVMVGETVEVKLFVSGFEQLSLRGLEGLLNYDENVLELVGVKLYEVTDEEVENLGYLNLENGKLAYVLGNGFNDSEVALLTLEFEALAEGSSEVTISNIILSYGEAFEVSNDTVTVNVSVLENGKGGDVEEDDTTTEEDNNKTEEETETKEENVKTEVVVKPVVLSSDYYIKNLTIDGYEIDFDMYTYEYSIKVPSDVTSLDIEVLLNNSNSIYYVEGNENFEEGENLVYLVVKAENGSTKTYTIKVEKEKEEVTESKTEIDEDETEEEETSSVSKTIIIILIILVIIGLIYVIFKDDEEDSKEEKKTSQPEKVKSEKTKVENKKIAEVKKTNKKGNKK